MRLPGFLTRNLRAKALASGIAIVTWVGVVYAGNPPESRTVNVKVPQDEASLPAKFVLASPIPDMSVRISGTREHVNAFDPASLQVSVDYRAIQHTGVQDVAVHVVNNDHDVSLDSVPSTLSIDVDVRDSVNVPLSIVLDATPPPGYEVKDEKVSRNPVAVSGPSRRLSGLAAQVHLNLANQKTNLEGEYKVFLYDRFGRRVGDLAVDPNTVIVSVTVASVETSRASAVLPKVSGSVPAGHYLAGIAASPPTVVLVGPQELLNGLDSVPTGVIFLTGLSTGDHVFLIRVNPPAGVTATPDTVTVTISVAALATPAPPSPTPTATPTPSVAPPTPS
jgi:YbbR domain-containing protein